MDETVITISFDVGGVLDEAAHIFLPILENVVMLKHRVIVVTAIGHGDPDRWGYSEEARYGTSFARLVGRGYVHGKHFHSLFVTPDAGGGGTRTGGYKDYVLRREGAAFHVDDNEGVIAGIKCCPVVRYHPSREIGEFKTTFWSLVPGFKGGIS